MRRREPDRPRGHVRRDELHRVVDRHPGGHRAAGGVDVEGDVARGVVGGEQQELGGDPVRGGVVDLTGQVDDPLGEEPVEHGVGGRQVEGAGHGFSSGADGCPRR